MTRRLSAAERARRRRVVDAHIAQHGLWCPGHPSHPAHPVKQRRDLTADHIYPRFAGGAESGPLRVLCRSANSARSKKPPTERGLDPSPVFDRRLPPP